MVKLVWETDDFTRALELAGLVAHEVPAEPATLGSEGDCGAMLALICLEHHLNREQLPWRELKPGVVGWNYATFEAIHELIRLMEHVYAIYGWSGRDKSMPIDRSQIPKIPDGIHRALKQIAQILRQDGIEHLQRDATTLGTPKVASTIEPLRLHVEEIDEFTKVGAISRALANRLLDEKGLLDKREDDIQLALEDILGVPFHKLDWGGEENDLFATVTINGRPATAAFALNGRGKTKGTLQLRDCGKNGDQIVRLAQSPADLLIVQSVGQISENLIKDVESKTSLRRHLGRRASYCIIDGQETARILLAYGKAV